MPTTGVLPAEISIQLERVVMKATFIMRANYEDLFQELTAQQGGEVIRAVFAFVNHKEIPEFTSAEARIAFKCIQKDLSFDINKYQKMCEKRKKAAEKRWTRKNAKKCKCTHNEDDDEDENEDEDEEINLSLTAQDKPAQGEREFSGEKIPLPAEFVDQVIARFERAVQTPAQKDVFVRRNARCLKDILAFCDHNIPLALQTISVCARRLQKGGVTGGYEAVCRNLPEYYEKARAELEEQAQAELTEQT